MGYSGVVSNATRTGLSRAAIVAAVALAGFAGGVVASEVAHRRGPPAPAAPGASAAPARLDPADGGAPGGPRILFDPASITLLPDASLELALPPGFDAGR